MNTVPHIVWFKESSSYSSSVVGDKGVDLGKLYTAGLPIPNGFIISTQTFKKIFTLEVQKQVQHAFSQISLGQPETIKQASRRIQNIISRAYIDHDVTVILHEAYQQLGNNAFVAVRSSQTIRQLPVHHATYLNIQGDANVIEAIRRTWASIFDANLLLWLYQHKVSPTDIDTAIVVQKMVQSQKAGVLFTNNPHNHNKRTVVIEAVWGLGEYYYQHQQHADWYEIEKQTWEVLGQRHRTQPIELVRKLGTTKMYPTPASRKHATKLTPEELTALAKLGVKTHQFLFFPQTIEWAIEDGQIFILQSQQLTEQVEQESTRLSQLKPILYGTGAIEGLVSGKVQVCTKPNDFQALHPQSIAVVPSLRVKAPQLKHVAAIIVDDGVYPRDIDYFGIPVIANTKCATSLLRNGQVVTAYGQQGIVYEGGLQASTSLPTKQKVTQQMQVYVSTGEPDKAEQLATHAVGGVGLLRAEFMVANIGIHPKFLLKKDKHELFKHYLYEGIKKVCRAFGNRPVIYRFLDFTTHDFRDLHSSEDYEPIELNPLLGYRGAYRQLSDPKVWELELEVVQRLRKEFDNLHLMFPFVRSVEEFVLLKQYLKKFKLLDIPSLQHWLMIDTPSIAYNLDAFASRGVHGFAIGARDLRILMTGADITLSSEFETMYQHDPAYMQTLRHIIQTGKKHNIPVMFCEHTIDQQILELLLDEGIDRISVNANQLEFVQRKLALKGKQ